MTGPIQPGASLGVLGGGQLGRMFAIAARRLGYRVHVLCPHDDTPAGQVADVEINAPYDDVDALKKFASCVDVVTFEFENVPAIAAETVAQHAPVRPSGSVLYTVQNRLREKEFLVRTGIPCAPFAPVRSLNELDAAITAVGTPAVLKTAAWGYDGKGQTLIQREDEGRTAWSLLGAEECVLEAFVDFDHELSVIVARGLDGQMAYYGPIENDHSQHILDVSVYPSNRLQSVADEAREMAAAIVTGLDAVGVICIEFFRARDGRLLVNEIAPRPHNSGHLTVDSCITCQFEQQVRAICGLPLGDTGILRPAAMANLLGDLWEPTTPRWHRALALPNVKLHLYGKHDARPGRKMGHLTALADQPAEARQAAVAARQMLVG